MINWTNSFIACGAFPSGNFDNEEKGRVHRTIFGRDRVSLGKAWDSNPEAWKIIDNKLYLGWNKKGIEDFNKSVAVRENADKIWKIAIGQE